MELDLWYSKQQAEIGQTYHELNERVDQLRRQVSSGSSMRGGGGTWAASSNTAMSSAAAPNPNAHPFVPSTPPRVPRAQQSTGNGGGEEFDTDWNVVRNSRTVGTPPPANGGMRGGAGGLDFPTPTGSPQALEKQTLENFFSKMTAVSNGPVFNMDLDNIYEQITGDDSPHHQQQQPMMGSNAFSVQSQQQKRPISTSSKLAVPVSSLTSLQNQHQTTSVQSAPGNHIRPQVILIPGGESDDPRKFDIDNSSKSQLLVEFKRKRVLQYESNGYVSPGEYVVVGGDRGEDIGLVIYTWCETRSNTVKGIGLRGSSLNRNIGVGSGTVLRIARPQEVQLLHGAQADLERRAVEVCMQQVLEHGLPMVIVDAEYQFDKKKLTFYYEAQQRMDFRELVRDLFKTFRARIWMENVEG